MIIVSHVESITQHKYIRDSVLLLLNTMKYYGYVVMTQRDKDVSLFIVYFIYELKVWY